MKWWMNRERYTMYIFVKMNSCRLYALFMRMYWEDKEKRVRKKWKDSMKENKVKDDCLIDDLDALQIVDAGLNSWLFFDFQFWL